MIAKKLFHGSDLEEIEKAYGIKKEDIVSFSANVNPLGISPALEKAMAENPLVVTRYPDREYTVLREALSSYCGANPEDIIVGAGATELISKAIEGIAPKAVLIPEPTYSEYKRKLESEGVKINSFLLTQERDFSLDMPAFLSAIPGNDLIMLCNPNNPTGNALRTSELEAICSEAKKHNALVLVDETYVEFAKDPGLISGAALTKDHDNLAILRGTSKFFCTPGLRLGYLICSSSKIKASVNKAKDPWSVNSVAGELAPVMFLDKEYINGTKVFITAETERLLGLLAPLPLHIYKPDANFVLMRIEKPGLTSADVFDYCIRRGLMIRDCSSFMGLSDNHIRICLNTKENNDKLIKVLREILG